jgi:hypothetical protein
MKYPGRLIKIGEKDAAIVKALKKQLNKALAASSDTVLKLDPDNPNFGPSTREVVKLFQARHVDAEGRPLKQDGEVGSLTWEALFGEASVVVTTTPDSDFLVTVLAIASGEEAKKVREQPKNSNKGPEVSEYLRRTGVRPGLAWCCAFVYWCFDEAAKQHGRANPMVKTAGCLHHWNHAQRKGAGRILKSQAVNNPALVKSGMIFIIDHGGGLGHTGLIEKVEGGRITTIEGNTDASKTREGGGVYRLHRKIVEINKGFIDYTPALG